MKIVMIAIAGLSMSWLNISYSQSKDFLKNYKAPDFKYRTLNLLFDGNSSGTSSSTTNIHRARFKSDINYFHRINSSLYQGTVNSLNSISASGVNSLSGLGWTIRNSHSLASYNRFFVNRGTFFFGAHANVNGQHQHIHSISDSIISNTMNFFVSPTLSFGWGRLEPVHFARQAMDIEYILRQDNIIDGMTDGALASLSDKIALASNRRFFDQRHKRMYELETIDSTIEQLGFIPKRNMRYFSRLQDSYFFALGNERLSGMRHEIGFNLQADFDIYSNNEFEPVGGLWFYQFSYHLPQSWSLQHDLTSRLEGNAHILKLMNYYSFGIYPSTRTAIRIGAQAGYNFDIDAEQSGGTIGVSSRITYYITPRFRLNGSCAINYSSNYWWNPIFQTSTVDNIYYRFDLGLTYAIF